MKLGSALDEAGASSMQGLDADENIGGELPSRVQDTLLAPLLARRRAADYMVERGHCLSVAASVRRYVFIFIFRTSAAIVCTHGH